MKPIRTPMCDSVQVAAPGDEARVDPLPSWRQRTDAAGVQIGSVWQPSVDEREALARGANVVLLVFAERTPPVWIGIGEGEMFEANGLDARDVDHLDVVIPADAETAAPALRLVEPE